MTLRSTRPAKIRSYGGGGKVGLIGCVGAPVFRIMVSGLAGLVVHSRQWEMRLLLTSMRFVGGRVTRESFSPWWQKFTQSPGAALMEQVNNEAVSTLGAFFEGKAAKHVLCGY